MVIPISSSTSSCFLAESEATKTVKTMMKTVYDTVGVFFLDNSHDFTCVVFLFYFLVEEDITSYFARIFSWAG